MQKITDTIIVDSIGAQVCDYWKGEDFGNVGIFPGAQPTSIELKDLPTIKTSGYTCCPKLDGERFFLVLRTTGSYFVNRNMEVFVTDMAWLPYIMSKGAILDGELVDSTFVVHDAIEVLGKNVKVNDFDKRLKAIDAALQMFRGGDIDVTPKGFAPVGDIGVLVKWMEDNHIKNDGIVFYPIKGGIGYKSQANFFKWKPPGYHTVDFLVKVKGATAELITWAKSQETTYKKIKASGLVDLEHFNGDGCIVEFLVQNQQFVPLKVRIDKPKGNNMYTVRKTLLNAKENIKVEDLIAYFS